jgi:DNA-binding NarL/FixJ family response regulator
MDRESTNRRLSKKDQRRDEMLEKAERDRDSRRLAPGVLCSTPLRVYIVSEVRLFREALVASLAGRGGLVVVGAGSSSETLSVIERLQPDVLLLDVAGRENLALPRQARQIAPELRTVAFAVADARADVLACAEAGFCGYVAKDGSLEDLVEAVHCSVRDELVCSPHIASMLFSRVGRVSARSSIPSADARLTTREREIAALVARGLQNKEVARQLGISDATIKNHIHNILQKLNIRRRGELAMLRIGLALHYLVFSTYWTINVFSAALEPNI